MDVRPAIGLRAASLPQRERRQPKPAGLSLVEVVASTMIVAMLGVATLNSLGAATRSADSIGNRAIAAALADELMAEILQQPYSDPDGGATFGTENGESTAARAGFDDVDDYHGWSVLPPQYRDGTVVPDRSNWRQRVEITWLVPSNPQQTSNADQGVKRIRVQIELNGQVLAEQTAIRTNID